MILTEFDKAHVVSNKNKRVALAVVELPDGKVNVITLEWFMKTSIRPPMFAISVGHERYSHVALQENRHFNLVIPSTEMREDVIFCGTKSGRDFDKIQERNMKTIIGKYKKLPILEDAVANFECKLVTQVNSGDHTIFVGEVKYSWVDESKEILKL